ncbi:hypothetical protein U9M48_026899 [Paspalum notatum var. saurae]|uniref:Uncharacterized protein n=1 Tax=Paspalum notatum var. saurae TaxID=547442 RepID=A0AAQ3WYT4_PASNO
MRNSSDSSPPSLVHQRRVPKASKHQEQLRLPITKPTRVTQSPRWTAITQAETGGLLDDAFKKEDDAEAPPPPTKHNLDKVSPEDSSGDLQRDDRRDHGRKAAAAATVVATLRPSQASSPHAVHDAPTLRDPCPRLRQRQSRCHNTSSRPRQRQPSREEELPNRRLQEGITTPSGVAIDGFRQEVQPPPPWTVPNATSRGR